MKSLVAGKWIEKEEKMYIRNPYNNEIIDTVPVMDENDIKEAIDNAKEGLEDMQSLSSYEILLKTANIIKERKEELAKTITLESGKPIRDARYEVDRAIETFTICAEEAKRIYGETIPFDSSRYGKGRFGFYIRVPVGIICAITPFNFPLNLVAHKLGPAFASANSVILKPAEETSITALKLGEILLKSGLPEKALSILTGPGETLGEKLVTHPDIRMVTFTGSLAVGERISKIAGLKKKILELGSNSSCVVMPDADLEFACDRMIMGAFSFSGQICISLQRAFIHSSIYDKFLEIFIPKVKKLKLGDPLSEDTDIGPVISQDAAKRIKEWLNEAKLMGAKFLFGGNNYGNLFEPTVIIDVPKVAKIYSEEAFAPVIIINKFDNIDEAISMVNDTKYGLQVGIFTKNIDVILNAINKFFVGGVIINDVPTFRSDLMPFGGVKSSGLGREGPKFAIEEMTEIKTICINVDRKK